jgi:hypothetical protein
MPVNTETYHRLQSNLEEKNVTLVAVSKTKPVSDIEALYAIGQRDFGENYVQELVDKHLQLPVDIRWHFIGHLQSNKVKYIAPFVHLIHGVDSLKLLQEINKQAVKNNRVINCLLQIYIAQEETKFGLDEKELMEILGSLQKEPLHNVTINGLMGMASFSSDQNVVRQEFRYLKSIFDNISNKIPSGLKVVHSPFILSMGMSDDYAIAVEEGGTMVRIGSLIFGAR